MSESGRKFLERKWLKMAQSMDHDKDGYITKDDAAQIANRIIEIGGIDPSSTQASQIRTKMLKSYQELFGSINDGNPVSYDDLIRALAEKQDVIRRLQYQNFQLFFDVIDQNGDGLIQREEFRKYFAIFCLSPDEADKVFDWIDLDGNGTLDLKEYSTFGEKFFFSTDENDPSKHYFGILH